jgi:hypothetical protein
MRFSLRWLMTATAYVALIIAAIAGQSYVLADVAWAISLLALCLAILIVCFARKQRQVLATGFVLLASVHIVGQFLVPSRLPAMRLLSAVGYNVASSGDIYEPDPANPGAYRGVVWIVPAIRTANAVGVLAAGLVGCLIGHLAYRLATEHTRECNDFETLT